MANEVNFLLLLPFERTSITMIQDLQKATASEPLSLDAEYSMQRSWRLDGDKLTFIACLPPSIPPQVNAPEIVGTKDDADDCLIGDVNLFLFEDDDADDEVNQRSEDGVQGGLKVVGELEIMIAQTNLQGHGYGTAILKAFLWYIISNVSEILSEYAASLPAEPKRTLALKYLRVRIDAANVRSIKLFEKVGFRKISETANYFGELELRWDVADFEEGEEKPKLATYRIDSYDTSEKEESLMC
jgi:RimJ/RimL family protein N-acetyltransferase